MRLTRIELYGFKSFARRTTLEFPYDAASRGIAAIVGPNGAGKSNVADAVRWALGEQSLKLIRGKKSEDVIFAGSGKKGRLGMAEVTLTIDNSDHSFPVEFPEVTITRRVYRDGEGEYLMNGATVRLLDVQLALAKARLGVRTYSVIGQGTIEHFLTSSPSERKELFDDAAGIKEFELRRHASELKLAATRVNLHEAEMLLHELEPRYRSLSRAVKRMQEREALEREFRELALRYYGSMWHETGTNLRDASGRAAALEAARGSADRAYREAAAAFDALKGEADTDDTQHLRKKYEELRRAHDEVREALFSKRTELEIARARAAEQGRAATVPLAGVHGFLVSVQEGLKRVTSHLKSARTLEAAQRLALEFEAVHALVSSKAAEFERALSGTQSEDGTRASTCAELEEKERHLTHEMEDINARMDERGKKDAERNTRFFELQKRMQDAMHALHDAEMRTSGVQVEVARLETRRDALREEMQQEVPDMVEEIKTLPAPEVTAVRPEELKPRLFRVKHERAVVGGIDTESAAEFETVRVRYEFLSTETADLKKALGDLERGIEELTELMHEQRRGAIHVINTEFDKFFRILFLGGTAKIVPLYGVVEDEADAVEQGEEKTRDTQKPAHRAGGKELVGIDIHATPPGKRVRDITMLSGGERALTAVALICAIISMNATPFVVLDEVDAALDEANAIRFAEIVRELSHRTQFIIITHNRATMEKGNILYGVTMSDDGVSKLLSVKLEEANTLAARST